MFLCIELCFYIKRRRIKLKKYFRKSFWQKGNGEFLSLAVVLPIIALLICFISSAVVVGTENQRLSFAAYNACRAAVVSDTYDSAQDRAVESYELNVCSIAEATSEHSFIPCEIEIVGGGNWKKGSMVKCTVRRYVATLMPFTSGVREQSITMMIENGG